MKTFAIVGLILTLIATVFLFVGSKHISWKMQTIGGQSEKEKDFYKSRQTYSAIGFGLLFFGFLLQLFAVFGKGNLMSGGEMKISIIFMAITIIFLLVYIAAKGITDWKIIAGLILIVIALPIFQLFNSGKISDLFLEYGDKKVRLVNSKLEEIKTIESKIKNISESIAKLIAENQAWTMRFEPEGGALRRMQNAKQEINKFLDEVGTTKERREEILAILNKMIEHDIREEEKKKK
ncbi:MAG: hypothetical protein PHP46_02425 [Candidatus Omnitrophica bacterium]|nr:hypothetical protein [Candidatus Omnitrophota bacterium]